MLNITLKDGKVLEVAAGTSIMELAKSISNKLAKNALAAKVDGEIKDLMFVLDKDAAVEILTSEDEETLGALRHSSAHIMAQAVQHLFPGVKFGIGPSIKDGYYYDFDTEHVFSPDDLAAIEKEMTKIIAADYAFERREVSRKEALEFFAAAGENYKVELIEGLPEDAVITMYTQGDFTDLCAGPHIPSTGKVKAIKMMSLAGAYWKGSEKNKMLQRIYGTSFLKKADLELYLTRLEEAKRRDHRKLGQALNLFTMVDEAPGMPLFLPKGMVLRNELECFMREQYKRWGYEEIKTPIMMNRILWETSGHWEHYRDNMYFTKIDEQDYCIKPMNCPGCMLVYKHNQHSYREFPIRYAEMGLVHRHEKSGVLHGLMRVRAFTQDDAHIFMLDNQIKDEIKAVIEMVDAVYSVFGFKYNIELSTKPEDAMGDPALWEIATESLRQALDEKGISYVVNEGDGAFYGPKIDFHLEDSIGRTWQCGTIQLDFQMPEKFDLVYVGEDGAKHRPVMIHRAIFGSIERFIGILIEHFAGAFPTWLAPVQVKLLPIAADKHGDYAKKLATQLDALGIRVETDLRNEKIGYKIREAQMEKIPYMLVIGDKEMESDEVAVRKRGEGDQGAVAIQDFIEKLLVEIKDKQ